MARFIMRKNESGELVIDGEHAGYSVQGAGGADALMSTLAAYLRIGDTVEVTSQDGYKSVLRVVQGIQGIN